MQINAINSINEKNWKQTNRLNEEAEQSKWSGAGNAAKGKGETEEFAHLKRQLSHLKDLNSKLHF